MYLGPYHPALPAPLTLDLELDEKRRSLLGWDLHIGRAELGLGYNHVGLEQQVLAHGLDWGRALHLVEALCAPCSQANLLAYVQAVKSMSHLIVPPRASYLRLVLAETESIISHLLNAADTMGALGMEDREASLR